MNSHRARRNRALSTRIGLVVAIILAQLAVLTWVLDGSSAHGGSGLVIAMEVIAFCAALVVALAPVRAPATNAQATDA